MRLLLLVMMVLGVNFAGYAQQGLVVAPTRIILTSKERTTEAGVTNLTGRTVTYRLTLEDMVMDAKGISTLASGTFPYSVKPFVRFMPRSLTLAPGQRQTVRIMANRPKDLPSGDYHSHLMLNEVLTPKVVTPTQNASPSATSEKFGLEIGMSYSTGVPLIVQVGQVTSSLVLNGAQLVREAAGASAVELDVTRTGNSEGYALLRGTTLAGEQAFEPRMVRIYREVENARVRQTIDPAKRAAVTQGGIKLEWLRGDDRKTVLQTLVVK